MSNELSTFFGESLMNVLDDFDRNFFRGFGRADRALYGKNTRHLMKTDVRETDDHFELAIDLPGFKKDEISLELNNGFLTISAEKTLEKTDENENGRLLRQERYAGTMRRSFYVDEYITEDDVKAMFENGVLRIAIPKKDAPEKPARKTILIEG